MKIRLETAQGELVTQGEIIPANKPFEVLMGGGGSEATGPGPGRLFVYTACVYGEQGREAGEGAERRGPDPGETVPIYREGCGFVLHEGINWKEKEP